MKPKALFTFSIGAALLFSPSYEAVAQINMQQMPGYSGGNPTAGATSRNRTDSPVVSPNSELKVVPQDFASLKLAPGFLVGLNVLDDADFAGSFRIDGKGNIALPILGLVHLSGETAEEASAQIRKLLLDAEILKDPQVSLSVLEYSAPEVTILGEIASPGKYPLLAPRKLVDVLALAGGPTVIAGNEVEIVSGNPPATPLMIHYSKNSDPKTVEDVLVHPGDTVQVKRAGIVYVLGAVNRPGGFVMQEDGSLSMLEAMSLANGTAPIAKTKTVYLLRHNPDGTGTIEELSYKGMAQGKYADIKLQSRDVIYVPTSAVKAALINSQTILSSAASASIYAATIR